MTIFDDARKGILVGNKLNDYVKDNPNILNEQDPDSGLTPLGIAAVEGYPIEVEQLLKKGVKADGRSRDGETPLLLAAWKAKAERPRIIQLLLAKTPSSSVDATTRAAENKTPLMYAIQNKDIESIRLLRKAKASLTIKNDDGFNAKEEAENTNDDAVLRALYPDKEKSNLAKLASVVVSFLLYIVAYVNNAFNGVVRRVFGLNPELDQRTDDAVNEGQQPGKDDFVKNVDNFVKENPVLERFFKDKKDFIQDLARKAADLEQDPNTSLCDKNVLPKTIKVTLHQQVIYCDDSSSMKREGRWESQKNLIKRITKITTRILPEGEGVALRFINQDVPDSSNLSLEGIGKIIDPMSWKPGGNTEIGTYLRSKILEPLVYSKLESKKLERPILVSIITDGKPEPEDKTELVKSIVECGQKLQGAGYPRESVKFMIGQVGTADGATRFLETLRNNQDIAPVAFVTSERLDERFADLHANDKELDRWLIETLFSPLKEAETKKNI